MQPFSMETCGATNYCQLAPVPYQTTFFLLHKAPVINSVSVLQFLVIHYAFANRVASCTKIHKLTDYYISQNRIEVELQKVVVNQFPEIFINILHMLWKHLCRYFLHLSMATSSQIWQPWPIEGNNRRKEDLLFQNVTLPFCITANLYEILETLMFKH